MELDQVLKPKEIDTISLKSNTQLFYVPAQNQQKPIQPRSACLSTSGYSQKKQIKNKSQNFNDNLYNVNRCNFKKDVLATRDKSVIVESKKKMIPSDQPIQKNNQVTNQQIEKKTEEKNYQNQYKVQNTKNYNFYLKQWMDTKQTQIAQGMKNFENLYQNKRNQSMNLKPNPDMEKKIGNIQKSFDTLKNQIETIVQDGHEILNNDQQQKVIEQATDQATSHDTSLKEKIIQIANNLPNFDLQNLSQTNLELLAHMLYMCECYRCECNQCKCAFALSQTNMKNMFHDLTTTNQALNHQVQTLQLKGKNHDRINYDTQFFKEIDIIKNSQYQSEFDEKKDKIPQLQQIVNQNFPVPHFFRSTYQSLFPSWKNNQRNNLENLNQLKIFKNKFNKSSSYQENYVQHQSNPIVLNPRKPKIEYFLQKVISHSLSPMNQHLKVRIKAFLTIDRKITTIFTQFYNFSMFNFMTKFQQIMKVYITNFYKIKTIIRIGLVNEILQIKKTISKIKQWKQFKNDIYQRFQFQLKLSLLGSQGVPLKGDPSLSQAYFSRSIYFSSSVVGRPFIFLSYSCMIFLNAPYFYKKNQDTQVSGSNS